MVISGVIRPPPEIRAVADRTALYVAKNGRTFEQRILGSEKGKTPKFAFLQQSSPFHMYYEERIQFYENGGEDQKEDEIKSEIEKADKEQTNKLAEDQRKQEKSKRASVIDPIAKAILSQRTKIAQMRSAQEESESKTDDGVKKITRLNNQMIAAPPPLNFVNIAAPASLSIAQLESIQLVAQFVALDGKGGSFLSQLTYREWNNPMFAFCQPRHGHFAYFSALVDAYRRILTIWTNNSNQETSTDSVELMAQSTDYCLDISAYRAEYEHDVEKQSLNRDDTGFSDGVAKVDWHDFVVVETIDFPVDEAVELSMLPPPPSLVDTSSAVSKKKIEVDGMDESDEDERDEQIRVVPSYTPRIVSANANKIETVIDPITGKSIPVNDMPEHMRIQLLDPKWAEERKKFQEKQKESNLVSGDLVASNLERFAQARGDRFGKKVRQLGPF